MRTTVAAMFACLLLQCVASSPAAAQAGSNCNWNISVFSWDSMIKGAFDCIYNGIPGAVPCLLRTPFCTPATGATETRGGAACTNCSKPVGLATGNTYITEADIELPGLGGGLKLVRIWNSMWPVSQSALQIGMFGPNWRSNFEEQLFFGADHYLKYARGDGAFWSFGYLGSGEWTTAAPANAPVTLTQGSSDWTMAFRDGEQRLFDNNSGKLVAIIDRNGNTTTLSYDSLGRLATVTGPAARHLYFAYGASTNLVSAVTSDFGDSVSYSYDSQGRLSQVVEPDGSTLNFQYDSNSFISAVLDSEGKVLEAHTYDSSGRALTSSQANGVNAVAISYGNQ